MKQAKFIYLNGVKKINDKFRFDFHKIIEQESSDKRLQLVDTLESTTECDAECLAGIVETIFTINLSVIIAGLITQIRIVVGSEFNPTNLSLTQLIARARELNTIVQLRDAYCVELRGANGEPLGEWLSSPTAELSFIVTLQQAVQATANALQTEITFWSNSSTGYLRGLTETQWNDYLYLKALRDAGSAAAAFRELIGDDWILRARLAQTKYGLDPTKLFGYLYGWDYARFARRAIQIDWDIYSATTQAGFRSRLWNAQNWLPTSSRLLRTNWANGGDFTVRTGVTPTIDPAHSLIEARKSPGDWLFDWLLWVENGNAPGTPGRTACPETNRDLCPRETSNCHRAGVYTLVDANRSAIDWSGALRGANDLPFYSSSIITGCSNARRSLARGTIALWAEIGIYQDYEEVTRLVNLLEHGSALPTPAARQALFQYLHHIYHTTQLTSAPRDVEYVAGKSSIIVEYNDPQNQDERTYEFLINILTPVDELTNVSSLAPNYATESLGSFTWGQHDTSLYLSDVQQIISQGANRTFGSSEFNSLTSTSQSQLISAKQNGTGAGGWTQFYPLGSTISVKNLQSGVPGAPPGVFLMTPDQFSIAQSLPRGPE